MDRNDKTGIFAVVSIFHLLLIWGFDGRAMTSCFSLDNLHGFGIAFARCLVVGVHFLWFALDLLRDLLVYAKLAVGFTLVLASLCHHHFPASNIVHCFVLVCKKITFYKRAVTHINALAYLLGLSFASDVCQSVFTGRIFPMLFVCSGGHCASDSLSTDFVSLGPVGVFGRLNYHSCEKLAKTIK